MAEARRRRRRCRKLRPAYAPSSSATSVATAGVCIRCETVATIDAVDLRRVDARSLERLARRRDAHHLHGLVRLGPAALDDPRAGLDPLVGGVDVAGDLGVGDHPAGPVAADAEDRGVLRRRCRSGSCSTVIRHSLSGCSRTSGWPGETRSPSSTIHSTTCRRAGPRRVSSRAGSDLADDRPGSRCGALPDARRPGRNVPFDGRDEHPPGRGRVDRGRVAVLVHERAARRRAGRAS